MYTIPLVFLITRRREGGRAGRQTFKYLSLTEALHSFNFVRIEVYPSSLSLSISSILTVSRNVPFPGNVQFHG